MVQNAFGPVHKSPQTTCLKITHRVLIWAPGGSRGKTKDLTVTLENGPSPSALRGAVATVGGALPPLLSPALGCGKAPPLGLRNLDVAHGDGANQRGNKRLAMYVWGNLALNFSARRMVGMSLQFPRRVAVEIVTQTSTKTHMAKECGM